jgi:hypothetical protein
MGLIPPRELLAWRSHSEYRLNYSILLSNWETLEILCATILLPWRWQSVRQRQADHAMIRPSPIMRGPMRDLTWRLALTLALLAMLAIFGPGIGSSAGSRLIEWATGQTPQAQVAHYLDAVAAGNRQAALSQWPMTEPADPILEARRTSVTNDLLAFGSGLHYKILEVTWWRTCCEPGIVNDPGQAGAARFQVVIHGKSRSEKIYTFDLLVPGGYWGEAAGYPVRRWDIVDIYPEEQAPLARIGR